MKNRPVCRGIKNKIWVCVSGCGVTVEVTLPSHFPSKMRWMVAINSAVTVIWRAELSRIEQQDAGTDESRAVCMFVCLLCVNAYVCVCVCDVLNTVCLRPAECLQEVTICWQDWMKHDRSIQHPFQILHNNIVEKTTCFVCFKALKRIIVNQLQVYGTHRPLRFLFVDI